MERGGGGGSGRNGGYMPPHKHNKSDRAKLRQRDIPPLARKAKGFSIRLLYGAFMVASSMTAVWDGGKLPKEWRKSNHQGTYKSRIEGQFTSPACERRDVPL